MKRLGTTTRIAFAMAMWTATVLLGLRLTGEWDDGHPALVASRTRLSESVAVSCSQMLSRGDVDGMRVVLQSLVARNGDVLSAKATPAPSAADRQASRQRAVEGAAGEEFPTILVGPHRTTWHAPDSTSASNQIAVPLLEANRHRGTIQIAFRPPVQKGMWGFFAMPSVRITLLATLANFLGFSIWLRRCFRHLDPAKAVPQRVRSALDTMNEGVLVLNQKGRVMLSNEAFAQVCGVDADRLQGRALESLGWEFADAPQRQPLEWLDALTAESPSPADAAVRLTDCQGRLRHFKANASPIVNPEGRREGTLLSLDDITVIEENNAALQETLQNLERSQAEVQEQNEQLSFLATRDPMTSCLNRRSFFEHFAEQWRSMQRYDYPLSCVMVDVDHFKSINDNHGHQTGDEVLKAVAAALLETARDTDYVCRYGGEEFCVLLPHVDLAGAAIAAERFRVAIENLEIQELQITASLGCSDNGQDPESAEQLIDQADQALYHAKRSGRNRVVRYDRLHRNDEAAAAEISGAEPQVDEQALLEQVQDLQDEASNQTLASSATREATA
ncbi:sensor domain-containing diguanylate cyclase [Roseimaritima sediminicola]|uniref:sensor domain-containing diguanylate cyclase n=1 Tax=Roseimaritima sediminicola TaxID=2662066 RepID=UPI0013874D2F|nr:diguanylate cyclase [Roseimaritima sediminicola]